jgi:surfeit locus 1 family protein
MRQYSSPPGSPQRRPRWLPTLAAVIGVLLTASAGNWQLGRAHEKERLQQAYDRSTSEPPVRLGVTRAKAADLRFRKVEAEGRFIKEGLVLLDNKTRNGQPGYEAIMPLKISGSSMHVLIDRGWIGTGPDRSRLPIIRTPEVPVKVVGMATVPGRFLELSKNASSGLVWQNLTIERYVASTGLEVQPIVVQQHNELDDGLLRSWERPDFGIATHYAYAGQWFLFCGLIIFFYVYFYVASFRSKKNQKDAPSAGRD